MSKNKKSWTTESVVTYMNGSKALKKRMESQCGSGGKAEEVEVRKGTGSPKCAINGKYGLLAMQVQLRIDQESKKP